jgi:hypothetical protein
MNSNSNDEGHFLAKPQRRKESMDVIKKKIVKNILNLKNMI